MTKNNDDWWRGAVFYQIYPRSFFDNNGDGIGDLPGITAKLEYVASLGVDAVWISPFFKSPMKDFGYDVSDYRDVDPLFGMNEDFDILISRAHQLGIKIVIDMVISHTSDKHPWFVESRAGKDNGKSDWYVWADARPDGSPPTNWQAVFGGPAWTFDTHREQYYLHNFLHEQPDLNFHNPELQEAILGTMRYWLSRGVDGFRLDVANYYFHDAELRDNPPRDLNDGLGFINSFEGVAPINMQRQLYNKTRPENIAFLGRIRELMNEYPGTMTVAEVGDEDVYKIAADYTYGEDRLNTSYNTQIMGGVNKPLTADLIRAPIEKYMSYEERGWPSWAFSNHDIIRAVSRWGRQSGYEANPDFPKMLVSMLTSLYGTTFIYQGEELGLPEGHVPFDKFQDPWGIAMWPKWPGRDGCRTPMPWDDFKDHAGFSHTAEDTWLPIDERHLPLSVARQEEDENSTLNYFRYFLQWRKGQPALITGDISFMDIDDQGIIGFTRTHPDQTIHCYFNLTDENKSVTEPRSGEQIKLAPFGSHFIGGNDVKIEPSEHQQAQNSSYRRS